MNDLQKTELSLLRCFTQLCDRLNLRYYLVCGTALGAVKYAGFIPWDDDVDVGMPRPDYEIFLEKAPGLLPEGLFLQNFRTDPAFPQIFSKLRDSRTTYIEKTVANLPINHGIYIDIFPLDGYPEKPSQARRLELKKRLYKHLLASAYAEPEGLRHKLEHRIKRLLGCHRHTARIARHYDALIRRWPPRDEGLWCNHGNWQGRLEYSPAAHYGAGTEAVFEGLKVRIPSQYAQYLTRKYGDYSLDPPAEDQVGHHYYTVCDCTRPYTDYTG